MADSKKSSIGGKSTCHLLNIKQADKTAKRIKLSFQRTYGTVTLLKAGKPIDVSLSLIDVSETGVGFFSEQLLPKGSQIEIMIPEPKILRLKGVVAWSVPIESGMLQRKFAFRSGMQFVFENEMQRAALIDFIGKVGTDPLELWKNSMSAAKETGAGPAAGFAEESPKEAPAETKESATVAIEGTPDAATETPQATAVESAAPTEAEAAAAEEPADAAQEPSEGSGGQSQAA